MSSKNRHMMSSVKEIKGVLHRGQHFKKKYLKFIYIADTKPNPKFKLLVSVPKKIIKLAVQRNLIKRRIKAFYFSKKEVNELNIKVIIIYTHSKPVKYLKLEKDMLSFEKLILNT